MKQIIALLTVGFMVSGCIETITAGAIFATSVASHYCNGTTEGGKEIVRDTFTSGIQVIPCEPEQ